MKVYDAVLLAEADTGIEVKTADELRRKIKQDPENWPNPVRAARITPAMSVVKTDTYTIMEEV